jgi:hypothetical protein
MTTHPAAFTSVSRQALDTAQDWTRRRVLQPFAALIKTINGQAAHDEIKAYIEDNEAVHTALVTRVLRLESRVRLLTRLAAALILTEVLRWALR